jgi:hypothetical protein
MVTGMSPAGLVVGLFAFAHENPQNYWSFIRFPAGNLVTFEVPGAIFTAAAALNDGGDVAGYYTGA